MNGFKLLLILFLLGSHSIGWNEELKIKTFTAASYTKILNQNEGREFTLVFWSTTCSPCLQELTLIADSKMYVNQKFIFVSIDNELDVSEIAAVIKGLQLEQLEHWVFQAGQSQDIIDSVDERWYGEVPRNYYFDDEHIRRRIKIIK